MKTLDIGKVYNLRTTTGFSLLFTPSELTAEDKATLDVIEGSPNAVVMGDLEVPGQGALPCMLLRGPKATCIVTYPPLYEQHRTIEDITPFVALTEDT